jgi:hypothetical protein
MHPGFRAAKALNPLLKYGGFAAVALVLSALVLHACAGSPKTTLRERLTAMSDADLVAYYQGVDARLRAVGEDVRRQTADTDEAPSSVSFQQTYFIGGEGNRLLKERAAAEKELLRRRIPRSEWNPRPD